MSLDGVQVVMMGKCNHTDVCAMCGIRMRLLYHDLNCPLCKAALPQVCTPTSHNTNNGALSCR
jgi:hypothetical protein